MSRMLSVLLIVLIGQYTFAQESFLRRADSLHKGRVIGVTTGISAAWSGSIVGLSQVWYKGIEKSKWHAFDDSKNWLQMDKVGHYYTAYKINQLTTDLYRWSGYNSRKSLWIGTGISLGYQTTLELFDAFSKDWGFSWSDMTANALGSISYLGQDLLWHEERIIPKFSYSPSKYAAIRPEVLGSSFAESLLKDYNGQTYWLSFSPGTFFESSRIPKWACVSVGYSAHEKLVGSSETYVDPMTVITYNSQREFILSLDIDFSKIPVKKIWLKVLLKQLNYLKIPFPAIIFRESKTLGSWLYF